MKPNLLWGGLSNWSAKAVCDFLMGAVRDLEPQAVSNTLNGLRRLDFRHPAFLQALAYIPQLVMEATTCLAYPFSMESQTSVE